MLGMTPVETQAKVRISGTLEYRDKDGRLIKAVPFSGAVPIEDEKKEQPHGDVRE